MNESETTSGKRNAPPATGTAANSCQQADAIGNGRAGDVPAATLTCKRCKCTWTPRTKKRPKTCPSCRSPNWDDSPLAVIHCYKCNHTWATRAEAIPQRCAGCNTILTRRAVWYNMSIKQYRKSAQYRKLSNVFNRSRKRKPRKG